MPLQVAKKRVYSVVAASQEEFVSQTLLYYSIQVSEGHVVMYSVWSMTTLAMFIISEDERKKKRIYHNLALNGNSNVVMTRIYLFFFC